MLQTFHRYQKSFLVFVLIAVLCIAMLLFGINPGGSGGQNAFALKINGEEISQTAFYEAKTNLESNYQQRFGNFYNQFLEATGTSLAQETIDTMVSQVLFKQLSSNLDLAVSNSSLVENLNQQFGGNFSREAYATFLQRTGQTSAGFEAKLKNNLKNKVLVDIINDHSVASKKEVEALIKKEESEYSFKKAVFTPEDFINKVETPKEEELLEYFEQNAVDYETPVKVKYNYIVVDPKENLDIVELLPEDIEVYYSDRIKEYTNPEQAKVRQIEIKFDSANPEDQTKKETIAEEIISKLGKGEKFSELAKLHSTDAKTKTKGGELGWVSKGVGSVGFDAVAFSTEAMGAPKLVVEDNRFLVIQVEDFKDEEVKPLESVKDEIKKLLQEREAPAYALVKAEDLLAEWQSLDKTLEEFAKEKNEKFSSTKNALTKEESAADNLKGLTAMVINNKEVSKQIQEIGDLSILVEVEAVEVSRIPDFSEIKEKVLNDYKQDKSVGYAREQAELLVSKLTEDTDFETEAKALGSKVELIESKKFQDRKDVLADPKIHKSVFSAQESKNIDSIFDFNNEFVAVSVTKIKEPSTEVINEKMEETQEKTLYKNRQIFLSSLLNKLKAEAEIEIAPGLINS